MTTAWDADQERLQDRAAAVRRQLDIDAELDHIGRAHLTGSAALGVMVARDVDLTVVVDALDDRVREQIGDLASRLLQRPEVGEVTIRDDTGSWNVDPAYPDGIYLNITCRDRDAEDWTLDLWFVDEPERQPDLDHLRTLRPLITAEVQQAILEIKRATQRRRADGTPLPSYEIYTAVIDHGVRGVDQFRRHEAGNGR